jgi:hypothetical protein
MTMVNWSKYAGKACAVASVIAVVGWMTGAGHHEPTAPELPPAAPAVSDNWTPDPDANLCAVTCPGYTPVAGGPTTLAQAQAEANSQRAAAAYWGGQKVTMPRAPRR